MAKLINTHGEVANTPLTQVTFEQWQASPNGNSLELFLSSDQTADLIGDQCKSFARICIDFPKFSDGRGYSAARLLRERYGFNGELRAVGDVLIDQLFFMKRCGFDTFALRDDQVLEDALAAFSTFSVSYQNDVLDQKPLFRRRMN
ncbi:MAG: DUF934 domain-containing protein [Oleibacter sp.]|nr:DUF934 domain-containing protein [Thalassolituus sp.]